MWLHILQTGTRVVLLLVQFCRKKANKNIFQKNHSISLSLYLIAASCRFLWLQTGFKWNSEDECKSWILTWVHFHTFFLHNRWDLAFLIRLHSLQIRGHMWLLHVCTLLGYFCNRNDCPWVTSAAPRALQIDGWTLCNSSWMFRVLRCKWWWFSAEKCSVAGMAISCSRGLMQCWPQSLSPCKRCM